MSWKSSSGSPPNHSFDIKTQSGLTNLYNSNVVKVEKYERPMGIPFLPHNGVVATTDKGDRWLIHKGPNYGKASDTVVVNANHMSNNWSKVEQKSASPGTTVGGLVKAGLADRQFNVFTGAKCWDATNGMMKAAGKK